MKIGLISKIFGFRFSLKRNIWECSSKVEHTAVSDFSSVNATIKIVSNQFNPDIWRHNRSMKFRLLPFPPMDFQIFGSYGKTNMLDIQSNVEEEEIVRLLMTESKNMSVSRDGGMVDTLVLGTSA